jgi:hypothetical protein
VAGNSLELLLDKLDESKRSFGPREAERTAALLRQLSRRRFTTAAELIRYHELLLFVRAYPQSARTLRLASQQLATFRTRVELLEASAADMTPFADPSVSGIAGTSVTDTFGYDIVKWLTSRYPSQLSFDWDWFADEYRLAEAWPRFMPLLDEDGFVEANVPYAEWLRKAKGREREVPWLIKRFDNLPLGAREKAELYNAQKLFVGWSPSDRASRTGMQLPVRNVFFHRAPLIQRRDVSLRDELEKPAPQIKRLSIKQGQRILDLARETSTMRYRELYGFTHGDERRVLQTSIGRGVEFFFVGLPAARRLPLRAYHAAMIFKNGIPVGYFEGLSLAERMESGFNLYYSFREGETAWIYAKLLSVFRHLLGVTAFAIDPYQIGFENEEGIESGAFWFYRKLGFRPVKPGLMELTEREEKKIATRKSYRTSAGTLRTLAAGPMIFELEQKRAGDWDRFQVRKVGLAVQARMAERYGTDAERMREQCERRVGRILGIDGTLSALSDFAVVLDLVRDLPDWSQTEKDGMVSIIRAKSGVDEARYLNLMQRHRKFRSALIKIGSKA